MLDLTKAVTNATNANNNPKKVNSNVKTSEIKNSEEVEKVEKTEEKQVATTPMNNVINDTGADRTPTNNVKLNVSPDIFVSLKKGIISDYYKVGKTLGEGNFL